MKKIIILLVFLQTTISFSQIEIVKDLYPGTANSSFRLPVILNGSIIFVANDGVTGFSLWKSDGTNAGTTLLKSFNNSAPNDYPRYSEKGIINNKLYFSASDNGLGDELWVTDGTLAGTMLVKEINPATDEGSEVFLITSLDNIIYFSANDGTTGYELWKSDGTTNGTVRITNNLENSVEFRALTPMNGYMYYTKTSPTIGRELWKTDGTLAGTTLVKDINAGTADGMQPNIFKHENTLYFTANNGIDGFELWKSDGTTNGTVLVKDIYTGTNGSYPGNFNVCNGIIYFIANDGFNSVFWKTDGTEAGTVKVFDNTIFGANSSTSNSYYSFDNVLYFWASDVNSVTSYINDFYKYDGTTLVKLIDQTVQSGNLYVGGAVKIDNKIYFSALGVFQLYQTDGTMAGTIPVASQFTNSLNPDVVNGLFKFNNAVYFNGITAAHGSEFFKYDPARLKTADFVKNNNIAIYPNPTISEININFKEFTEASTLEIYDINSRLLKTETLKNINNTINIENFQSGLYLFKIVSQKGTKTIKIQKN